MAVYRLENDELVGVGKATQKSIEKNFDLGITTLAAELISEAVLRGLFVNTIKILDPNIMVIAEEYKADSRRKRIDILALDREANLIVIELKRGYVNSSVIKSQVIPYCDMASKITFWELVDAHQHHMEKQNAKGDARRAILEFLGWKKPQPLKFNRQVRNILVAAKFGLALHKSTLQLIQNQVYIKLLRLTASRIDGKLYIEIGQCDLLTGPPIHLLETCAADTGEQVKRRGGAVLERYNLNEGDVTHPKLSIRDLANKVISIVITKGGAKPDYLRKITWSMPKFYIVNCRGLTSMNKIKTHKVNSCYILNDNKIYVEGKIYTLSEKWARNIIPSIESILSRYPDLGLRYEKIN